MQFIGMILGRIMAWVISGIIFKVITSFGVGVVVFWGVGELINAAFAEVQNLTSTLPALMAQVVALVRIDDAIKVIFSALSIRLSLKSFGLGGIGSLFVKGAATAPP